MYQTLWDEWLNKWAQLLGCDQVPPSDALIATLPYYQFYTIFKKAYIDAEKKISLNRKKNAFWKELFVCIFFFMLVMQIALTVYIIWKSEVKNCEVKNYIQIETSLLLIWIIVSLIIAKQLDIGKYQETWSRHWRYQFLRRQEILWFLMEEESYKNLSSDEMVRTFIKRIMKIEELNINKFCDNMENKEKGMLEEFSEMLGAVKQKVE